MNGYVDDISSSKIYSDDYGRITFNSDATYYANWLGQHTFKGGFQYERLSNLVQRGAAFPTINISWNAARGTLSGTSVRGKYGFYTVTRGTVTEGDISFSNLGLFIQDAWTINKQLTINYGVRTEQEDIPSYRPENPGVHFSFADKIAPRVGFAYDVKGDSQWKVYGNWGVYQDLMKLSLSRILFGADRWVDHFYTLDTFDWQSIQCGYPPVGGPSCPGTFIEQADFRFVANSTTNSLVDPDLKPMKTQELTFGMDHELNRTMSLGVRYSHKWLNRTIEAFGVLLPGVGEIYRIANPGFGWDASPLTDPRISPGLNCGNCKPQPPAKRVYDSVEVRLRKRFSNSWVGTTSYTYSRLFGNYAGLANSDEAASGNARTDPNSSRNFDQLTMYYDHNAEIWSKDVSRPIVRMCSRHRVVRVQVGNGCGTQLHPPVGNAAPDADESPLWHLLLPVRARRSRPDADLRADRPARAARLQDATLHPEREPERRQSVRSGHGDGRLHAAVSRQHQPALHGVLQGLRPGGVCQRAVEQRAAGRTVHAAEHVSRPARHQIQREYQLLTDRALTRAGPSTGSGPAIRRIVSCCASG